MFPLTIFENFSLLKRKWKKGERERVRILSLSCSLIQQWAVKETWENSLMNLSHSLFKVTSSSATPTTSSNPIKISINWVSIEPIFQLFFFLSLSRKKVQFASIFQENFSFELFQWNFVPRQRKIFNETLKKRRKTTIKMKAQTDIYRSQLAEKSSTQIVNFNGKTVKSLKYENLSIDFVFFGNHWKVDMTT